MARPVATRSRDRLGTVLVIEDEPDIAELIRIMLEDEGYRVVCHVEGRLGLAEAERLAPDAVVLDLCLNDIDGRKILHSLRNDPRTAETPIIIASAMTYRLTPEERDMAHSVLLKPFGFEELHRAVTDALGAPPK